MIFLVGDPYKPVFATVTVRGDNPKYHRKYWPLLDYIAYSHLHRQLNGENNAHSVIDDSKGLW